MSKVFSILTISFVFALFSAVNPQSGTTGVSGTITDQSGAAVSGASVKISNPATGFTRNATTGDDGKFNFPSISPATYLIEIEASNFKKAVKRDVQALVNNPIEIEISLEPGDVSVVVDVTGGDIESVINNQDASAGNNFVPSQITQLPTDLRRVTDLLTLQPGVTADGYAAGSRSDQANVTLDGIDINDQQNGGRTDQFQTSQDTVLRITSESIEEFRITTTNANANQGRSSGAQISLVTKSGTNDFRGALFYFYRPTAFSANNFFNNLDGVERPSLARNVFGGAIGGPVIKDKVFFFYSYEGQREKLGRSVCQVVPLAHMGQGQLKFSGSAPGDEPDTVRPLTLTTAQLNQVFSSVGINPAAVAVFANATSRYTANSTCDGDGVNTGGFRFNAPTTIDENTHIARFDWNVNDSQNIYLRGNYQYDLTQGISAFPDTPATALWDHPYGFVVAHNWTISDDKINNFRYGLTRQSFSTQGDSSENSISFRFVYSPLFYARTLSRVTPTHNLTDDFTLVKGKHMFQFGGNARIIRNQRLDYANAYDSAVTNPSFYGSSGEVVSDAFFDAGYTIAGSDVAIVQNAAAALIGRFSQYSGNFTFDLEGNVVAPGTPTLRKFATEEYDAYFQDIWKPFRNLTLTLGLRYGVSRPVYEQNGYQVVPTERLGDFFERRKEAAAQGRPLNDLIAFEKAGPVNNGQGFYSMDWNNVQPRIAAAWSPSFKNKFLKTIFGEEGVSVIRGGFAMTNDHFGGQLAVSFDALSSIGFTSSTTIAANTYNVTNNPAPRFTGFGQPVRNLPGIPAPAQRFSTEVSADCLSGAVSCPPNIETSLDGTIITPTHYTWNVSYGRRLPKGMYIEATYIGRKARNLLAARDVMALNNLFDRQSNMDWYTAAGKVHDLRAANVAYDSPSVNIPYFNNIFGPGMGDRVRAIVARELGIDDPTFSSLNPTQVVLYLVSRQGDYNFLDWTYIQFLLDDAGPTPNLFYHPQYGAFSSFSSVAYSDYNGGTVTLRQRLGETLSFDLNYTLSKSMDNASGLQTGDSYASQFILNSLRPEDNYSYSDFDVRHSLNANFLFELPIGRGRSYFSNVNKIADALAGGWRLRGIYRWNSGQPISAPFDLAQWATNFNVQSAGTRVANVRAKAVRATQNLFSDPQAAYNSFRNARPGETGERNVFRAPGYQVTDLGLAKQFNMPWSEKQKLQFRMEVFNVFNQQYFDDSNFTRNSYGLRIDSDVAGSAAPGDFGRIFTAIQGNPRRMQFGLRYSF